MEKIESSYWAKREEKQAYYREVFEQYKKEKDCSHNSVYHRYRLYCEIWGDDLSLMEWMLKELRIENYKWRQLEREMEKEIKMFGIRLSVN